MQNMNNTLIFEICGVLISCILVLFFFVGAIKDARQSMNELNKHEDLKALRRRERSSVHLD
jgi:hypothetical protein